MDRSLAERARLPESEARLLSHADIVAVIAEQEADEREARRSAMLDARASEIIDFLSLRPVVTPSGRFIPVRASLEGLARLARSHGITAPPDLSAASLRAFARALAESEEALP